MTCPECGSNQHSVTDSRDGGVQVVRRQRQCLACGHRWKTVEVSSGAPVLRTTEELEALRAENNRLKARLSRATSSLYTALDVLKEANKEE